jgi:hypothetical protein
MLELAYWEAEWEHNQRQWCLDLINARDGITNIIDDSPSLKIISPRSWMSRMNARAVKPKP